MFQFRRFPAYAYFVQRTLTEYCSAGFPHSVIRGYNAYVRLPTAYRSLSRPSSALDAKAFPLRSFQLDLLARLRAYLDQEILVLTRIMQASDSVHCSIVLPIIDSTKNFVTSLLLARNFLLASLFSFQGANSNLFQGQIEMLTLLDEHFNLISKRSGGPKWTRTTDLTIISRAL